MKCFVCPVCKGGLNDDGKTLRCSLGHCFDKSKFQYVNLLMSSKSSAKRHGDDRLMVRARRDFLDKGYYKFLCDEICNVCLNYLENDSIVLDAGCGECYYSSAVINTLKGNNIFASVYGVDISKDALEFAFKRKSGVITAVGSVFNLPVSDSSVDALLNIFSPEAFDEYRRVLKSGGVLVRVIPLEKHLFGLKEAIYDNPYLNDVPSADIEGFRLCEEIIVKKEITVNSSEDILNLFKMTPYYYKTGKSDQQKIESVNKLVTQAEFGIRIYRKES
ncbi:MAG: methyltransferase domain-containing protein [Clostridia bacterium]|nr:methyltransferase domain-containing protein [Clostridia bacterium]